MPDIKKALSLKKLEYYETHLSLINCLLPIRTDKVNNGKLTPMEIKVLAAFMSLEGEVANYRFGPTGRKTVMKQLELSNAGLSNYISTMTEKGFLLKKVDHLYEIWNILIPAPNEQMYMFRLINRGND